jgi:hypothetical protein
VKGKEGDELPGERPFCLPRLTTEKDGHRTATTAEISSRIKSYFIRYTLNQV